MDNVEYRSTRLTIGDSSLIGFTNEASEILKLDIKARFDLTLKESEFRENFLKVFSGNSDDPEEINRVIASWLALVNGTKRMAIVSDNDPDNIIAIAPTALISERIDSSRVDNFHDFLQSKFETIKNYGAFNAYVAEASYREIFNKAFNNDKLTKEMVEADLDNWIVFLKHFLTDDKIKLKSSKQDKIQELNNPINIDKKDTLFEGDEFEDDEYE